MAFISLYSLENNENGLGFFDFAIWTKHHENWFVTVSLSLIFKLVKQLIGFFAPKGKPSRGK